MAPETISFRGPWKISYTQWYQQGLTLPRYKVRFLNGPLINSEVYWSEQQFRMYTNNDQAFIRLLEEEQYIQTNITIIDNMTGVQDMLLNQTVIAAHEAEIERRQRLIANLQAKAEKESEYVFLRDLVDDDVIYFKLAFISQDGLTYSRYYTYAALKCQGVWYSTGPRAPKAYTDDQMIKWWSDNDVTDIHIAAEWDIV